MTDFRVAIAGAGGRMGTANIRAVANTPGMIVHSAFDRPGSPAIGRDAGEIAGMARFDIAIGDDPAAALEGADALIDFTAPTVSVLLSELAAQRGMVDIIGTTGCSKEEDWAIAKSGSAGARIVKTGNFSLGVNILQGLVRQVAAALPDYDIEVLEMHHNKKVDAPSGTALMLGEAAARGRGVELAAVAKHGREGITGARPPGEIGVSVMRAGGIVGEHSVVFASDEEILTLAHSARDRSLFAKGAVAAARWVAGRPAGAYDMQDVLGFR